jgi:hypothetical protein
MSRSKRPHGSVKMLAMQLLASAGSYGMRTQALAAACGMDVKAMSGCLSYYAKAGDLERVLDDRRRITWRLAPGVTASPVAEAMAQQLQHAVGQSSQAIRVGVQHMLAGAQAMLDQAGLCWLDVAATAEHARLLEAALPVRVPNIARGQQAPAAAPVLQAARQLVSPKDEGGGSAPAKVEAPHRQNTKPVRPVQQVVSIKHKPLAGPAVVPPGLQVTVCPSGRDERYSVDPATFTGGELMAEWRQRRAG